jgi:hypothetical protein
MKAAAEKNLFLPAWGGSMDSPPETSPIDKTRVLHIMKQSTQRARRGETVESDTSALDREAAAKLAASATEDQAIDAMVRRNVDLCGA